MVAMDGRSMTVGEHLRVPYIIEAWSEAHRDGEWVRHAEHPELPDCAAEAESIEEALSRLEDRRVSVLLDLLARSRPPMVQRPLVGVAYARAQLARAGLLDKVDDIWDLTVDEYASASSRAGK
jgi:predicted RNase H-like HicB family nuclease